MSGLLSTSKDRCTVKHPFTSSDLKNLARFMFGAQRVNNPEVARFVSCMGPVIIKHDGQNGAVWSVGGKRLESAPDFREIMSVLPVANKKYNGDTYLSVNVLGRHQYLVISFLGQDLMWFRSEQELINYYRESGVEPDVQRFVRRHVAWHTASA
ncbi:hypothetical protein pEaSNUABM5_00210 [Erwinia phage pEa_SNUABM_5]|uniref:Uncharacterized protein n=1 Tax=Erwinia phage pEa_SNUABM_5 TaxID=2797313 RepID=A0A7T8EPL5_9CAUD|nr:hypothetical protein MPK73_gp210 [Erwinia phage pEa_SNUABM_5]QQO90352.1 hypothetical protein pEaSNUABM5_00210 [Erwinia phage pEa_SNUABM_5]